MNYIDINSIENQSLYININLDDAQASSELIQWAIFKDGSDSAVISFDNSGGYANVTTGAYYHKLSLDLNSLTFTTELVDESQYTIEGVFNSKVVYKGKFQTTQKDLSNFSINENKYKSRNSNNNYIILE